MLIVFVFHTALMTFIFYKARIFSIFRFSFYVTFFHITSAISFVFEKFIRCGKFKAQIWWSTCFELRRGTLIVAAVSTVVVGGVCNVLCLYKMRWYFFQCPDFQCFYTVWNFCIFLSHLFVLDMQFVTRLRRFVAVIIQWPLCLSSVQPQFWTDAEMYFCCAAMY